MEMAIPFEPRALTVLNEAYRIIAPMEYKISGLNVKHAAAIRYVDGV